MKSNHVQKLVLLASLATSLTNAYAARVEEPLNLHDYPAVNDPSLKSIEVHLHAGWETRYVSEGRDNLDGDSLFSLAVEFGGEYIYGGVWFGFSPDQEYDELQFSLGLKKTLGDFEGYVGWTHLRNPFENVHDNEIGAGVSYSALPWDLKISLDTYYSLNAEGSFWEISLAREFSISEDFTLSAMLIYGVNQGYISDGHTGGNHVACRFEAGYVICENLTFNAHLDFSAAINRDSAMEGDELLRDIIHAGIALEWSF
jgi:hypothetical protein